MNQYLKCYQVVMRTLAPVFIGSGKKIEKKEYIFLNHQKVGIPDIQGMYGKLCKLGKKNDFEDYLLGRQNIDLTTWLKIQKIKIEDIRPYLKYTLDCADAVIGGKAKELQVMECIKDAYGNPYIPGSSLKGMFRTVLMGTDILCEPSKYQGVKQKLWNNKDGKASRTNYLKREMGDVEGITYRTMHREKTRPQDAVNDVMQGFIISDSEPLSVDSLVLCQKVDVHKGGEGKQLPILRECMKPNTEIRFTITIDTQVCPYLAEDIFDSVRVFMDSYYDNFLSAFADIKKPGEKDVFLGGGCGFASKTIIYPLYGKRESLDVIPKIFEHTKIPRNHKHYLDKNYGVSPRTLKCTKYQGKMYQMGLCRIERMEML